MPSTILIHSDSIDSSVLLCTDLNFTSQYFTPLSTKVLYYRVQTHRNDYEKYQETH